MSALTLSGVRKNFGAIEVIRSFDLDVAAGERLAVIGPNGSGKSTLFNLISGRFAADAGVISLHGESIAGRKPYEIYRRGLARSFQTSNLFNHLSVFENLRVAALWACGDRYAFWHALEHRGEARQRADDMLMRLGLWARRDTPAGVLTYAEQRALEIGVTMVGGASVVLLDEPTAGMSRSESATAVALIGVLTEGKTLIMVEHDMDVVFGLADRIAVLVQGQLIALGTPAQIRANRRVQEAYLGKTPC